MAYGYTASGYGYVQDMPYAYIHEFTRTSMAGKIRRLRGGYTSMWQKLRHSLPFEVLCSTEVVKVSRRADGVYVIVRNADGDEKVMEFDKVILSGALPFKNGRVYRSSSNLEGQFYFYFLSLHLYYLLHQFLIQDALILSFGK